MVGAHKTYPGIAGGTSKGYIVIVRSSFFGQFFLVCEERIGSQPCFGVKPVYGQYDPDRRLTLTLTLTLPLPLTLTYCRHPRTRTETAPRPRWRSVYDSILLASAFSTLERCEGGGVCPAAARVLYHPLSVGCQPPLAGVTIHPHFPLA
jgi:hypothetical protein